MGASIISNQKMATVSGIDELKPSVVECPDLRGGAALLLAALSCQGETIIKEIDKVDRGYEKLGEKIDAIGGKLVRVEE